MLYVHTWLYRMWLNVSFFYSILLHIFTSFPKYWTIFINFSICFHILSEISYFIQTLDDFFQILLIFFKTPGDFHSFVLLDLEISCFIFILPASFSKILGIFPSLIPNFPWIFQSTLMASSQLDSVFPEGHISYEVRQGLPEHRVLSTGSFFPRWYYSWLKNFSRMFPDHLDDCGLELASAVGKQTVNDNLIHALAERWNPSTSTFWFPWGEMTLLMDEFSEIMGLPEPVWSAWRPIGETVFDQCQGSGSPRRFSPHDRTQVLALDRGEWERICGPARNLQTVWGICGSQFLISNSSRKNPTCDGLMHCGISSLSRWTELHGYQDSSTSAKVGKSTDQPSLHSHGRTRFFIPRVDPFHTRRINSSRRVHLLHYNLGSSGMCQPELAHSDTMVKSFFQLLDTDSWSTTFRKKKLYGTTLIVRNHLPDILMHMASDSGYLAHSSAHTIIQSGVSGSSLRDRSA